MQPRHPLFAFLPLSLSLSLHVVYANTTRQRLSTFMGYIRVKWFICMIIKVLTMQKCE